MKKNSAEIVLIILAIVAVILILFGVLAGCVISDRIHGNGTSAATETSSPISSETVPEGEGPDVGTTSDLSGIPSDKTDAAFSGIAGVTSAPTENTASESVVDGIDADGSTSAIPSQTVPEETAADGIGETSDNEADGTEISSPEDTASPDETDDAEGTEASSSTGAPETTEDPEAITAPETTNTPITTKTPETTRTPVTTKTPETTSTPVTTKTPETTSTPVTTKTPETTSTPVTTKTPETTRTPVTTQAPETTTSPETTGCDHSFYMFSYTAANCSSPAIAEYCCSKCGITESRYEGEANDAHYYGIIKTQSASCTQEGKKEYTCSYCGYYYFETIPKTEHWYGITRTQYPTCTSDGLEEKLCYYCWECGESKVLPALGHDYQPVPKTVVNCLTKNDQTFRCSRCERTYTVTGEPGSHSFVFVKTVAPTETVSGYDLYECSDCDITEKRNFVSATGDPREFLGFCTMIDYTSKAMPSEKHGDIIEFLISNPGQNYYSDKATVYEVKDLDGEFSLISSHVIYEYYRSLYYGSSGSGYYVSLNKKPNNSGNSIIGNNINPEACITEMLAWADRTVAELGITTSTRVYDAIDIINSYIDNYMIYTYGQHSFHIGIESGQGVCMVYSAMFQLLCQRCGIECYYASDDPHNHAYNYIVTPEGNRLWIDPTWNDATINGYEADVYYKDNPEALAEHYHRYFLLEWEIFESRHGYEHRTSPFLNG